MRRLLFSFSAILATTPPSIAQWGDALAGQSVQALSASLEDTLFPATRGGALLRSTNGGQTWSGIPGFARERRAVFTLVGRSGTVYDRRSRSHLRADSRALVSTVTGLPPGRSGGAASPPPTVIYSARRSEYRPDRWSIAPIAVFAAGRYLDPLDPFVPENGFRTDPERRDATRRVLMRYFPAGVNLSVVRGGVEIGTLTINDLGDLSDRNLFGGCFLGYGGHGTTENLPQVGDGDALAVPGGRNWPQGQSRTRAATQGERATFMRVAREVLRDSGATNLSAASLRLRETADPTIAVRLIDLDRDGAPELVGTVEAREGTALHHLLLVASGVGTATRPLLVGYGRASVDDHGKGDGAEWFEDHLDIDADGVDEIITQKARYEGTYYQIYARRGQGWTVVYRGGGGGC
jgi:hypothetical protein